MQSYSSRTFHNSTLCINKNADYSLTYRNLILYIQERLPKLAERGIRTLDTTFQSYNSLANYRLQPLGHLSRCKIILVWCPRPDLH